jgi:hypothetical protein
MSRVNRIYNGDFSRDLNNWTTSGAAAHVSDQGYLELGAAHIPAGAAIAQQFGIGVGREYTLELAIKATGAAGSLDLNISDSQANPVYEATIPAQAEWQRWSVRVGLPWGSFTLTLGDGDVDVVVDDVSIAHIVKTRQQLARLVADRLGPLADEADKTYLGDEQGGAYADAIDAALRAVRALDPAGRPDVRYLSVDNLDNCLDQIELAMLHTLHRYWTTKTDYGLGPRQEHLSQISAGIERLIGVAVGGRNASAGRSVKVRRLTHGGW